MAPTEHPVQASDALAAGRELRRRLSRELDGIETAIGLSARRVVAGNIRSAYGDEYRPIGDPVNGPRASRTSPSPAHRGRSRKAISAASV